MYKITNQYISIIDFSSSNIKFSLNSLFNTFLLNSSSDSWSDNNLNTKQYFMFDKEILAKVIKDAREKKKAEIEKKKNTKVEAVKEKKEDQSKSCKRKKDN